MDLLEAIESLDANCFAGLTVQNQCSKQITLTDPKLCCAGLDGKLFDSQFSSWSAAVQFAPCETCKV